MLFEQGALCSHVALGPTTYVAGLSRVLLLRIGITCELIRTPDSQVLCTANESESAFEKAPWAPRFGMAA